MGDYIAKTAFSSVDLNDEFFKSLKSDYGNGFTSWFKSKGAEPCYIFVNPAGALAGFLYVKVETAKVRDVIPPLPEGEIVKIGTFKVNAHGTKLGQRFLKKALDYATANLCNIIYVTAFEKHTALVNLFSSYGFVEHGEKHTNAGIEKVYVKRLDVVTGNDRIDYPLINLKRPRGKWLLAIYPGYHTKLFPDSKLHNESYDELEDVGHSNSIEKAYICGMSGAARIQPGDIIVMYRTSDQNGRAEYRSVATSVCTLVRRRSKRDFGDFPRFASAVGPISVFDEDELATWWAKRQFYCLEMLYNAALTKRIIRKHLIEGECLGREIRPDVIKLSDEQFAAIIKMGAVNGRLIIN